MTTIHSFYANFNNDSASRLILKLSDGSSFNEGHTQIEFLSPSNDLMVTHQLGGQLNFDALTEVELPLKALKRKYKGLIKAAIHSTISKEKFLLILGFDKEEEPVELVLVAE